MTPAILSSFAIIIFAALIHASFQLSVSMLTLLSGHSLGRKTAHLRVVRLMGSFISGVAILTFVMISAIAYYFFMFVHHSIVNEQLLAAIVSGLMVGLGVATWAFYYRRKSAGTALWLPRGLARHLTSRTKATKQHAEALGLGMASVVAELIFIIAPMLGAALAIVILPGFWWQFAGILTYVLVSLLSLLIAFALVGSGHHISKIQAWREKNKRFLQFAAGGSLIILAAFIFVDRMLGISIYGVF